MKKRLIIYISVAVAVVALVAASVILLLKASEANGNKATADEKPTAAATEPTQSATPDETLPPEEESVLTDTSALQEPTVEETRLEITTPDKLARMLEQNGNTAEQLYALGCSQLVTVDSSGSTAKISLFTFKDLVWTEDESLSCSGYVGRNGVTSDMHEGGNASPRGLYGIGDAFYIYSKPETGLDTFEVTNNTYWVDDPDSKYYNKRVEGTSDMDWDSAEHMIDYTTAYEYGFVINYNLEAKYNAGSAIFFHVSYGPTAGCVGTDKAMVLKYLAALDGGIKPYILIL